MTDLASLRSHPLRPAWKLEYDRAPSGRKAKIQFRGADRYFVLDPGARYEPGSFLDLLHAPSALAVKDEWVRMGQDRKFSVLTTVVDCPWYWMILSVPPLPDLPVGSTALLDGLVPALRTTKGWRREDNSRFVPLWSAIPLVPSSSGGIMFCSARYEKDDLFW